MHVTCRPFANLNGYLLYRLISLFKLLTYSLLTIFRLVQLFSFINGITKFFQTILTFHS